MGKSRREEHEAFLFWLLETIKTQKIDTLIVAGDIFDTGTPPNYALELYYNFLKALSMVETLGATIITAGNHDSIATLKAPKQLLETLNVHVITDGGEEENQLLPLYKNGILAGIVCAVPFLRDGVVRKSVSGEGVADKESALNLGIRKHYENLLQQAQTVQEDRDIPLIATGHLTTLGSRSSESERDIYIGGTLDIGGDYLGAKFDYVALGHLHTNQRVGVNHVRYSGSPIPLSFSEASQEKKVNLVSFRNREIEVEELLIPLHRKLLLLKGDEQSIKEALENVDDKSTWIEIHLKDANPTYANQAIREYASTLELLILAIKIERTEKQLHAKELNVTSLDELTPYDVFGRRLEMETLENKTFKDALDIAFKEVVEKVVNQ